MPENTCRQLLLSFFFPSNHEIFVFSSTLKMLLLHVFPDLRETGMWGRKISKKLYELSKPAESSHVGNSWQGLLIEFKALHHFQIVVTAAVGAATGERGETLVIISETLLSLTGCHRILRTVEFQFSPIMKHWKRTPSYQHACSLEGTKSWLVGMSGEKKPLENHTLVSAAAGNRSRCLPKRIN